MQSQRSRGSDEENEYSPDSKSPMPPHSDRPVSPAVNGIPQLSRQTSDYYLNAMNGGMAMPPHLRNEMQPSPRSQSPAHYHVPVTSQQQRPALTSNPSSGYNPPQILEPPTTNGQQQAGSGNNSPHMNAALGWQSPHHHAMNVAQQNDYAYPDPHNGYANVNAQLYYSQQARPHSTGPLDYQTPLRQEIWAQHQQ